MANDAMKFGYALGELFLHILNHVEAFKNTSSQ
jgi:hypothetical protein